MSRAALLERASAQLELHVLAATVLAMAEDHDEKVERLETQRLLEQAAARRVPEPEDGRVQVPLADRVPRGPGGPIPVVVAMGDADPRRLDTLLDLPDDVQLIVVGDRPGLAEWAAATGPDMVGVVEPGVLV